MSLSEPNADDLRVDLRILLGALAARWLRVLLVTLLLLGATFAVLMFVPKLYESSSSVLVEERANAFTRTANEAPSSNAVTIEAMIASQIELIKSRDNLLPVIDKLGLRDVREFNGGGGSPIAGLLSLLGRKPEPKSIEQTVLENLEERLTVARQGTSAVISIIVQSQDPQRAADIANAIAESHVARRAGLSISDTAEASGWLESEIEKLRTRVRDAENAVATFKIDNDLYQTSNGSAGGGASILDQQLSNIATQITSAQERKNNAQSRAELIRGLLKQGQSIEGVADVQNSLVIQNLTQSKASLQAELAQRSSTLLANHPTIKALKAQIAAVESQIVVEGRKVADALESQARVESGLEQSLRADLDRLKQSVSSATRNSVTLESLEREAKAQRDLLESYLARYSDAAARTDASSTLPDVRVVTYAAPSDKPAVPNIVLIMSAVGFLAVAGQIGGILIGELTSGRAIVERSPAAVAETVPEPAPAPPQPAPVPAAAKAAPAPQRRSLRGLFARAPRPVTEPQEPAAPAEAAPVAPAAVSVAPQPVMAAAASAMPEPPAAAAYEAPPAAANVAADPGDAALELSNLAADIVIGRVRVVFLAAMSGFDAVERVANLLVDSAIQHGLSVATIDAGSGRPSAEPGLSDLAAETASFGDVVHKVSEGLASVPWGTQQQLERRSMKPVTLVEALTDIYEVVIVATGPVDMFSALPVFSGVEGRLVLVSDQHVPDRTAIQASLAQSATLGYEVGQMVTAPAERSVA